MPLIPNKRPYVFSLECRTTLKVLRFMFNLKVETITAGRLRMKFTEGRLLQKYADGPIAGLLHVSHNISPGASAL